MSTIEPTHLAVITGLLSPIFYFFVLPRILAVLPTRIQFISKCLVVLFSTLVMSIVGCVVAITYTIIGKRSEINYVVSRLFGILASGPCGVTYTIKGKENLENYPAIVVCNHQSSMDMMVLGTVFPKHCVVMAKKELLYFPFLGLYMKLSNAIFIDRKNHKKAIDTSTQAVADMKRLNSGIWIFPEGTRSRLDTADLLPFKKGAFHLAIQSQQPILPIVSQGYSHVYDSSKRRFPGGNLEIRVLEPISTVGMTVDDVNDLMDKTRTLMLKHLKEMDHRQHGSSLSSSPSKTTTSTTTTTSTLEKSSTPSEPLSKNMTTTTTTTTKMTTTTNAAYKSAETNGMNGHSTPLAKTTAISFVGDGQDETTSVKKRKTLKD